MRVPCCLGEILRYCYGALKREGGGGGWTTYIYIIHTRTYTVCVLNNYF